jgi:hypothetical protein
MESNDRDRPAEPIQRRPYESPRIEESGRFEHLVMTCGFMVGTPFCDANPLPQSTG